MTSYTYSLIKEICNQSMACKLTFGFYASLVAFIMAQNLTRLSFEVFSLESPWTLDYVLAPLPPLGIGFSVAVREGGGGVILQP